MLAFITAVVSRTIVNNSNIFFRRIDKRRNGARSNSSGRYGFTWFDWLLGGLAKLRLFYTRREQHRSEQQRSRQIVRSAGNMKRVLRINEPANNPEKKNCPMTKGIDRR